MTIPPSEAGLKAGDHHYKAFVGPIEEYDLMAAMQFNLLTALGLRQHHTLLDVGCGSLRGGKLLIPYLLPDRYFGIDPEQWLIDDGIEHEVGHDQVAIKRPRFDTSADFRLTVFGETFDYILVHSIFSHTTPDQTRTCLAEAAQVMRPTSIFVASYLQGDQDYTGDHWVYPGRVTYTPAFMTAITEAAGLTYVPVDWPHITGQNWFAAVQPGSEHLVHDVGGDRTALPILKDQLRVMEDRLLRTQAHPYVKFGLWLRRLFGGGGE